MDIAYTTILGNRPGERIGIVKLGEDGYYPAKGYDAPENSIGEVKTFVQELNDRMGVPEDVAQSATWGSLFGWHVPAAQRAVAFFKAREPISD